MAALGLCMGGASVSVVTVVKDPDESQLLATMHSVASQTHDDVRYVLVDGGTTGIGACVAGQLWPMTEFVLISEPDRGIYDAMNKAVAQASGDLLLFLNAGDTLVPHALQRLVSHATEIRDEAIIYCDYWFGTTAASAPKRLNCAFDLYNMGVAHQALIIPRDLFRRLGPYRTDFRIVSDHLWMREARDRGVPFAHLSERLVCIDDRGLSSGASPNDLACFEAETAARVTMRYDFVTDELARKLFRYRKDPSVRPSIDDQGRSPIQRGCFGPFIGTAGRPGVGLHRQVCPESRPFAMELSGDSRRRS